MFVVVLEKVEGYEPGLHDIPAQIARRLLKERKAENPTGKKQVEKRETRASTRTKTTKGSNKGARKSK